MIPNLKMSSVPAWDLSDTSEDETIVKELYEEMSNMKIEKYQDSNNSESSSNTIIEAEKKRKISRNTKVS